MKENNILIIAAAIIPFLILAFNVFVYDIASLISASTKQFPEILGFFLGVILYAGPSVTVIFFLQTAMWKKAFGAVVFTATIVPIIFVLAVVMSCEFKGICL